MTDPIAALTFPTSAYPYPTGYANLDDVKARVNAGSWDPDNPTELPNAASVNGWLMEATANIDAALADRGYYVPIQADPAWLAPTGMPLYNGIGLQAWMMLKAAAAAYAVHHVEQARHGGMGEREDTNASTWMALYTGFITSIQNETDNLEAFGVGGSFAPPLDPLHMLLAARRRCERPFFFRDMNLGSDHSIATSETDVPPPASGDTFLLTGPDPDA